MDRLKLVLFFLFFLFTFISVYGVEYTTGTPNCSVSTTPNWSKFPYRMCNASNFKPVNKGHIYIVGTGIDKNHPELKNKGNIWRYEYCPNITHTDGVSSDHDTTMISMIIGNNLSPWATPMFGYMNIYSYNVMPCSWEGNNSKIVQALQDITGQVERPAAVSIGLNIETKNVTCYEGMFFSNNTMKPNYVDYCFGALTNLVKVLFNKGIPVFVPAGNGFYPGYLHEFYDFASHPFRYVGYDICRASEMGLNGYYYPFFSSPVFKRTSTNLARPIIIGSYKYETRKLASWYQYVDLQDNQATFDTGHSNYGDCVEFYAPTSIPMLAVNSLTNSTGYFDWVSLADPSNNVTIPGKPLTTGYYLCDIGNYATSWATAVAHLFYYKFAFEVPPASLKNATGLDALLNQTFYNSTYSYLETTTGMTVLDSRYYFNETTYSSYTHRNLRNPFCIQIEMF